MKRVARLALLACPRPFRRDFGDQYLQLVDDLRNHRGHGRGRVLAGLLTDTCVTAPAMRWEHLMNSTKNDLTIVVAVVAAAAMLVVAPFSAIPLALIAMLLVLAARRHDQPSRTRQPTGAAAVCLGPHSRHPRHGRLRRAQHQRQR